MLHNKQLIIDKINQSIKKQKIVLNKEVMNIQGDSEKKKRDDQY